MKRTNNLTISLLVILLILAVAFIYKGEWRPFSVSSEWKKEALALTSENYDTANPDVIELVNGCYRMYTHGWPTGEDYNNSIYSFYSCDGLSWEPEGVRIKQASMPAAVMLDDGRIRLYFGGSPYEDQPVQSLRSAISDDRLNFTIEKGNYLITGEGDLKDIKTIVHLEVVKLENGFRIYFDDGEMIAGDLPQNQGTGWNWPVSRIRSAYSEDGLNWKLDPGVRINIEQSPLDEMQRAGSCTVIKVGDEYHMYFKAGFSPWEDFKPYKRWAWSGIYKAVSDDGLNFTIIDERLFGEPGEDPKIIRMGDVLRIYVSAETGETGIESIKNEIYSYIKR